MAERTVTKSAAIRDSLSQRERVRVRENAPNLEIPRDLP
jgi:hypothetical protein